MRRIGRSGSGQGQVQGLDWNAVDRATVRADLDGLAGLRDAALILIGSDALLRCWNSQRSSSPTSRLSRTAPARSPCATRRQTKEGRGHVRYLGAGTVAAVQRWVQAAGFSAGRLFRRVRRGDVVGTEAMGVRSVRAIIAKRATAADITVRVAAHSLLVGPAQSLAAAGADLVKLQQASELEGAAFAGPLRTPPARRPRRRREAAVPRRPVAPRASISWGPWCPAPNTLRHDA